MRVNFTKTLFTLFMFSIFLPLCCSEAQDTVKVALKDIEQDIATLNWTVEQVSLGKKQENLFYLNGQLSILKFYHQLGKMQADSARAKRDTVAQK